MKVALVHDYLGEFGGAERVLLALSEIWPEAPIYTAFYRKGSAYDRFKKRKIVTSWAQNVPFFAKFLHSPLRFLAPWIWGSFVRQLADYEVVISSANWYVTKGFGRRDPSTLLRPFDSFHSLRAQGRSEPQRPVEVCYCHTPPRYLYGYPTSVNWRKYWLVRVYALIVNHFMRVYDFEAAQRVDFFIANSKEVQARISKFYRRDSKVIYPPTDIKKFEIRNSKFETKEKYFLVVSRLVGAKNVDLAVKVCADLNLNLKVVGSGRQIGNLKKMAGESVEFLGDVTDSELVELYKNCLAVIFAASQEDFGLVPVEAMAAGKPVLALKEGGVLETVVDGKTGLFFEEPTVEALTKAVDKFEKHGKWDSGAIKRHAQRFGKDRFKKQILDFVKGKVKLSIGN